MSSMTITRAALGRAAKIGALYDVRTESFLNDTVFASKTEDDIVDIIQLGESEIEFVMSDSIQEKCRKLNVEAELQVSFLAGMVKLAGSGAFLAEKAESTRTKSMSLIYKVKTVNEQVMLKQNRSKIDIDALLDQSDVATHVVVGIDWGAMCTVTCTHENKGNEDTTKIKGNLNAKLETLKCIISGKGSGEEPFEDTTKDQLKEISFTCKSDVSAPSKELPVTFEGAVEFARSLPSLVGDTNNGKGVPLTYSLMTLGNVAKICKSHLQVDQFYMAIDEAAVKECTSILEQVTRNKQEFHDLCTDVHDHSAFIPNECTSRISEIMSEVDVQESVFKAKIQTKLKSVRSGSAEMSDLVECLGQIKSEATLSAKYKGDIETTRKALNRAREIGRWREKGITYLGKNDPLIKDRKRNVVVFYKTDIGNETDGYEQIQRLFWRLQATYESDDDYEFIVVDQYISSDIWPAGMQRSTIQKHKHGSCVSKDLYTDLGEDIFLCLIKVANPEPSPYPKERTYVELVCPNAMAGNGGRCGDYSVNWRCSECKHLIEYGTETQLFYCDCGKSNPEEATFRCDDKYHNMCFVKYSEDLKTKLLEHRTIKSINILLLGETGVGKSTWINGFPNYLMFNGLTEAIESSEFHVLVPSKFSVTSPEGKTTSVQVGDPDINEVTSVGESATREPKTYTFLIGGARICLIDTPGVGDSRGIPQDRINMGKILSHLASFYEIHAVCILLKPNITRLSPMFRFCIQELLVQLHSSVKRNIVFCFTHSRSTFYRPGDTLDVLNEELNKRQVGIQVSARDCFCFDNEAFRLLAGIKNGVDFTPAEIDMFANSWVQSVLECKRLLEYIRDAITPHKVRETLSLNECRRTVIAMTKPLAHVANTINDNVQNARIAKTEIADVKNRIEFLQKNLKFKRYGLRRKALDYPRTVCAHEDCVEHVRVDDEQSSNMTTNTWYKQICHERCHLTGIPTETTNDHRLLNCACIGDINCLRAECGHDFKIHMHITYEMEKFVQGEFLTEDDQKEISEKGNFKAQKEASIRMIDTKIGSLKSEQKKILETGAKYASFLKENALLHHNDAIGDCLDMSIEEAMSKPKTERSNSYIKSLKQMRQEYDNERAILENAIASADGITITCDEVKRLQHDLYKLDHFGETLKELFKGISITHTTQSNRYCGKLVLVATTLNSNKKPSVLSSINMTTVWQGFTDIGSTAASTVRQGISTIGSSATSVARKGGQVAKWVKDQAVGPTYSHNDGSTESVII